MAETYKVLGQVNPAATTLTALYTVPALTQAIVSTITIVNRSATATTFRLAVAVAGAADSLMQYCGGYDTPIDGNAALSLTLGMTLGAGDVIRVYATLGTLTFNAFGEELS